MDITKSMLSEIEGQTQQAQVTENFLYFELYWDIEMNKASVSGRSRVFLVSHFNFELKKKVIWRETMSIHFKKVSIWLPAIKMKWNKKPKVLVTYSPAVTAVCVKHSRLI